MNEDPTATATPVLEGNGIRLEPLSLTHIPALTAIALHPTNWQHMTLRIRTAADVERMVRDALAERGNALAWSTFANNQLAGGTRLYDLHPTHRTAEIGFTWLAPAFRGTGINPRVKLLQLTHAFESMQLRRVAFKTHHQNLQSQAALRKLGAIYESTFRNHMLMPDGSTRHSAYFSITAEDWPATKANLLQRIEKEPLH